MALNEYHYDQFNKQRFNNVIVNVYVCSDSVTWNVLVWSGGYEFEPLSGRTWGAWCLCPKSLLNQYTFIVWYPIVFIRFHNLHLWYWNSYLYSLISSGEDSAFAHFAAAIANRYNLAFSFHHVPITAGWTKHDMKGL